MSTSSVKQIFPRGVENPNPRYLVVMPILIATALLIYKTTTSIGVLRSTVSSHTMRARPEIVALGRAVLSLLAVVLIGPIIERICHNVKLQNTSQQELSETSRKGVLLKFLHAVFTISIRTVPGLIAGVIISMFVVQWLPAHIFE